jgi:hypothetical protein
METPSRKKFKEITAERGLKAALQWREQRMSGMNTGKKQPEPNALSASKKFERFARQSPQ